MSDASAADQARGRVESLVWYRDPAASGWRSRLWLENRDEILVYDSGDWEIRTIKAQGFTVASGKEATIDRAKECALKVYFALVVDVDLPPRADEKPEGEHRSGK